MEHTESHLDLGTAEGAARALRTTGDIIADDLTARCLAYNAFRQLPYQHQSTEAYDLCHHWPILLGLTQEADSEIGTKAYQIWLRLTQERVNGESSHA
jgi:hypothetical protein